MAESEDIQKLVVLLEARTAAFEKAMTRATAKANTTARTIETRFTKMQRGMNASFGAINSGLAKFGIAGVGVASFIAALGEAKRITQWADDLVDLAEQTGIAVDQLQILQELAEKTGSSGEEMAKGLKFFTRELGEASVKITDFSRLAELNNIALRNQDGSLRSTQAVLSDFIDLISRFNTEQERGKAGAILFGAANFELGESFQGGLAAVDEVAADMERYGRTVTPEKAAELADYNEKLRVFAAIWEAFKVDVVLAAGDALEDIAAVLQAIGEALGIISPNAGILELLLGSKGSPAEVIGWPPVSIKTTDSYSDLNTELEKTNQEISDLEDAEIPLVDDETAKNAAIQRQAELNRLLEQRADQELELNELLETRKQIAKENLTEDLANKPGTVPAGPGAVPVGDDFDDRRFDFDDPFTPATEAVPASTKPPPVLPPTIDTSAADEAAREAERQAEAIARVTENLTFEQEQLGRTAREQEIYNQLKAAGVDINSAAGQEIARLAGLLYDEQQALELIVQEMDFLRTSAKDFTETLITGLVDGAKATDVLADAVKRLADRLISTGVDQLFEALLGATGTPGILGAIFGRATGGPINAGQMYRVHKDELIVPRGPGTVIPAGAARRMGGGESWNVSYAPLITIQGNADQSTMAYLREQLFRDMETSLPTALKRNYRNRAIG